MKVVYLLGNGFDLNFELRTSYRHFYDYYLKRDISPTIKEESRKAIRVFKRKDLDTEKWADLEEALGKYTNHFQKGQEEVFIDLLDDISDALSEYLLEIDKRIFYSKNKKAIREAIKKDLCKPWEKLAKDGDNEQEGLPFFDSEQNINIDIITFNYTRTFEDIFNWYNYRQTIVLNRWKAGGKKHESVLKSIIHVHGTLESDIIFGVNDVTQIENSAFQNNRLIECRMVKSTLNGNLHNSRDARCAEKIRRADLICIFGTSMGKTDCRWWNRIVKRMKEDRNCRVIIFHYDPSIGEADENAIKEIKGRLFAHLNTERVFGTDSERQIAELQERIFVSINSDMFRTSNFENARG